MNEIYSHSSQVLVWLGCDHEAEDDEIFFRQDIWGFTRIERGTGETTELATEMINLLASKVKEEPYSGHPSCPGANPLLEFGKDFTRVWASACRIL